MRKSPILIVGLFASALMACDGLNESAYNGNKLLGTAFQCRSDEAASAGFWRDVASNRVTRSASVQKQSLTTTWRIKLLGSRAEVTAFSGSTQTLEPPESFTVEQASGGLLLTSADRHPGESPQVITIDPANSSFVYSSQLVTPLYNRANVFHGTCVPYI